MMQKILIHVTNEETKVALMEDNHLAEFFFERKRSAGIVGNIYKGRVGKVLPGMQAAFVDIGLEKAAFLYVDDIFVEGSDAVPETMEIEKPVAPEVSEVPAEEQANHHEPAKKHVKKSIEEILVE
jgi:ribonuclease G